MAVSVDRSESDRRGLAEAQRLRPERLSVVDADSIMEWAREERPDLIVAASHAGRVERVLGGAARRLATSAPCPALILSMRALAESRRLRALGPGRLSLVHVGPRALIEASARSAGGAAARDIADDDRAWLAEVAEGVPGAEPVALTGLAAEAAVAWLGSFAAHLAREAPCPALLTR